MSLGHVWLFVTPGCSPPGSSAHGVFQARILEWVAIPFRGSSQPRDWTRASCIAGGFFTVQAPRDQSSNAGFASFASRHFSSLPFSLITPNSFLALCSSALCPKICMAGKWGSPLSQRLVRPPSSCLENAALFPSGRLLHPVVWGNLLEPLLESWFFPCGLRGAPGSGDSDLVAAQSICQQASGDSPCLGTPCLWLRPGRELAVGVGAGMLRCWGQCAGRRKRFVITLITGLLAECRASPAWL